MIVQSRDKLSSPGGFLHLYVPPPPKLFLYVSSLVSPVQNFTNTHFLPVSDFSVLVLDKEKRSMISSAEQ